MRGITDIMCRLWHDESGASAAEYAMILAIVGAGVAGAALVLGTAIADQMNQSATCISTNGLTCG